MGERRWGKWGRLIKWGNSSIKLRTKTLLDIDLEFVKIETEIAIWKATWSA